MKKVLIYICAIAVMIAVAASGRVGAQSLYNDVEYHSFRSPVSTRLNPAAFPDNSKFYITFPRTSIGVSLPFSYNDIGFKYDEKEDRTIINLNNFINNLTDENGNTSLRLGLNIEYEMFGLGFKVKNLVNVNYALGLRFSGALTIPLNVLHLVTEGNMGENSELEFGTKNLARFQAYIYNSVGVAMKIPQTDATVGARFNLLQGAQIISVDNLSLKLTTDSVQSQWRISADYLARAAGMFNFMPDTSGQFQIIKEGAKWNNYFPQNFGFTFDLGAKYEYKDFVFSASVLDIGPGVRWTQNPAKLSHKNDHSVTFRGIDIEPLISNGRFDDSAAAFGNMLVDSLGLFDTAWSQKSFWCPVPTRLYLGASYSLKSYLRFGVLFHGEWNPKFRQNTLLSVHFNLFDWLELTAGNSFTFNGKKPDFFSPSVSASLNIGRVFHLFFTLDYISDFYLSDLKAFHFYFGASIVGYTRPKRIDYSSQGSIKLEVE